MKQIAVLALLTASALSADIVTTDGKTYTGYVVTKVDPDGISIRHDSGSAKIPFEKLSPELQKEYGFDKEKADEHRKATLQAEEKRMHQETADAQKRAESRDAQQDATQEKAFLEAVNKRAIMAKVDAFQFSDIGLIGDIKIGTLESEPIKNKLGNKVGTRPVWKYKEKPVDGVIFATKGVQAGTRLDTTGDHLGLPRTSETVIEWEGKAWRIGKIQYKTQQGLFRTCPYFTSSEAEAVAFFRANGFGDGAADAVKAAR